MTPPTIETLNRMIALRGQSDEEILRPLERSVDLQEKTEEIAELVLSYIASKQQEVLEKIDSVIQVLEPQQQQMIQEGLRKLEFVERATETAKGVLSEAQERKEKTRHSLESAGALLKYDQARLDSVKKALEKLEGVRKPLDRFVGEVGRRAVMVAGDQTIERRRRKKEGHL